MAEVKFLAAVTATCAPCRSAITALQPLTFVAVRVRRSAC